MRPAAPARETFTAAIAFEAGRAVHLRLRSGDEGRQAIDAAGIGNHRLRLGLRLILRLRTMLALFAMMFARLLVAVARLIGLTAFARLEVALLIVFARHERLLLLRYEARCADISVRVVRVFRQLSDAEDWLEILSAARDFH